MKTAVKKKTAVPVIVEPQEDPRITNMRAMTQQIVIIDSIVVPKDHILPRLLLSSEAGRLTTGQEFFGRADSTSVYVNGMENKIYFSLPDQHRQQQLYTSDKLGNAWSSPAQLQGISNGISEAAYPFMLSDGITFYFAGKGEESIGGFDIFLTRYDSHSSSFLKPENIGMPFNSEANDYFYAVDELNHIGYFVSDRHQPAGKACIYTFIPSDTRKTYDPSVYSEQQIRSFADIVRIADTWGRGTERQAALSRLKDLRNQRPANANTKQAAPISQLIINDELTYSNTKDFRSIEAAAKYTTLLSSRQRLEKLNNELTLLRDTYAKAILSDRQSLRSEILSTEDEMRRLYESIRSLEKQIRNIENKTLQ